ncbi:unnamed protein product, partial [marine sediment metagenome]
SVKANILTAVTYSKDTSSKANIIETLTKVNSAKTNIEAVGQQANSAKANILDTDIIKANSAKQNVKTTYYSGCTYDWQLSPSEGVNRGYQS